MSFLEAVPVVGNDEWVFRSKYPAQIHRSANGLIAVRFTEHFFHTSDPATIEFLCQVAISEERNKGVVVWQKPAESAPKTTKARKSKAS